jgi:hypothetical protein
MGAISTWYRQFDHIPHPSSLLIANAADFSDCRNATMIADS